jgi:hypothetical protein
MSTPQPQGFDFKKRVLCAQLFVVCVIGACSGAKDAPPGSKTAGKNSPVKIAGPLYSWDDLCLAMEKRIARCPKEEKETGVFSKRCRSEEHDRVCFSLLNDKAARLILTCAAESACVESESAFERCTRNLFTTMPMSKEDTARQEQCRTHMAECELNFEERCVAPFLVERLQKGVWQCLEQQCKSVRTCTELLLEREGCL